MKRLFIGVTLLALSFAFTFSGTATADACPGWVCSWRSDGNRWCCVKTGEGVDYCNFAETQDGCWCTTCSIE
jgi:hypothetical protein